MGYIGVQPAKGQYRKLTDISSGFNGTATSFQLSVPPGGVNYYIIPSSPQQLMVSVGGIIQNPGVDYTTTGSQIIFTTAPASGLSFFGTFLGDVGNGVSASGVNYIATGAGAVTRTTASKLADVVSVKDFGAVGDGTTNDRTAFINAFAAAFNVYVPPGTYLCNGSLTTLRSGSKLFGAGSSSIIKWGTAQSDLTIDTKTNVVVEDLVIDGGGQTTNIYTGLAGCNGISIKASSNVKINRVTAQNMGIVNQSNPGGVPPAYDVAFSGYGFNVSARTGAVSNIRITNCTAKNIAGAGYQKGDGFYIEGYRSGVATDYMDVIIDSCYSSTCGRHCYTVAGETPESVPSGIVFNNCYGEKSALDGCDIESGYKVILDNCIWKNCGNDQTYYNPVSVFGATYRLLAAIALDNYCQDIVINNNSFENCYYGFTYGGSANVTISNSIFKNSTTSDINQGLATGISNFKLVNCHFLSTTGALYYYSTGQTDFVASGCTFAGQVIFSSMIGGTFTGCTFKKGININGGSSGFSRSKIVDSTFTNFAGDAITMLSGSGHQYCIIKGNVFYGTGNLVNGITFAFQGAVGWIVSDNKFIGLTGSGIRILNGDANHYADICGNNFESCGYGIYVSQSIKQSLIANNTFSSITNWCIIINDIFSATPMPNGPSIMNNLTRVGCVNGIAVSVNTGTYDRTMLVGNNVSSCSGTKWSLSGGNANGVVANNITT